MIELRTDIKIRDLKPSMKDLDRLDDVVLQEGLVAAAKADGESSRVGGRANRYTPTLSFLGLQFSLAAYDEQQGAVIVNDWGKMRKGYPALEEFEAICRAKGYKSIKVLAEPHLVIDGRMRKLPEFLHAMKSGDPALLGKIRLGVWDLVEVNGAKVVQPYAWRLQELRNTINGSERVYVLPHIVSPTKEGLKLFWDEWVTYKGFEGLVITAGEQRYRVKPIRTLEACIVGINKKQRILNEEVTSVRIALMDKEGDFVEIGDLGTATDRTVSRMLYQLMAYKAQDEGKTIYVKPFVVVELEFTTTYEAEQAKLRWNGERYVKVGTVQFFSLREPRLKRFRQDKQPMPQDIPIEQLI